MADLTVFEDVPTPEGLSPFVEGHGPETGVSVVEPDPSWATTGARLVDEVRRAVPWALEVEHVGSTAVPGLPAKPVIDLHLVVADPDDEAYVDALAPLGLVLRIREPWWHRHRMLRGHDPLTNLHVFPPDSPEPARHVLFRDHLRASAADRALYAEAKRGAMAEANAAGESVQEYNGRKEAVVREIYQRAFRAAGLL